MKSVIPFKAKGEKPVETVFGYITLVILQLFFLIGFFISEKIIGNIFCIVAFILIALWMKKIIRTVHFKEKHIEIKHFYGNLEIVEYTQLKKFYENSIPSASQFVYIIKYQVAGRKKLKKLTFYLTNFDFKAFKHELIVKKKNGFEKSSIS